MDKIPRGPYDGEIMSRWIFFSCGVLALTSCWTDTGPNSIRAVPGGSPASDSLQNTWNPGAAEGIAARINNEILTWRDVLDTLKQLRKEDVTPELRKSKLREMAEERLFLQTAKANNIQVSEPEVDESIRREQRGYPNEDEFEKAIRIRHGTMTAYREEKRKQALIFKLYRYLVQKSWASPDRSTPGLMLDFVPPEDVRLYYEDHAQQFRAIERITFWRLALQFSTEKEKEMKKVMAGSILRRLAEGCDFPMMAFYYSDTGRAKGMRETGVTRDDIKEFFLPSTVTLLFERLKEGEISPLVEDGKSLNLFRLDQRLLQRAESFEEAQGKIRNFLENQRREENRKKLRLHLVKDAYLWPGDLFATE